MNSETAPAEGTCTSEPPYWSGDANGQSDPERDWSVYVFVGGCALCALFGGVIGWFLNDLL